MHGLFDLAPSKIKIIEKSHTVLLLGVLFISCNKKFKVQ